MILTLTTHGSTSKIELTIMFLQPYDSQGSHTDQLTSPNNSQMRVREDNVISVTLRQIY